MLMRKLAILILTCAVLSSTAHAGWYICYNYEGAIGNSPIHLSIQIENAWSKPKKVLGVDGVYYYDKHREPITIVGTLTDGKKLRLDEKVKGSVTGSFEFDLSETEVTGIWTNPKSGKALPLKLTKTGHLFDDTGEIPFGVKGYKMEEVPIIQSASLPEFLFVGHYSTSPGQARKGPQ